MANASIKGRAALLITFFFLFGCGAIRPVPEKYIENVTGRILTDFVVTKPGLIVPDRQTRKKMFEKYPPAIASKACRDPNNSTQGVPLLLKNPLPSVSFGGGYGYDMRTVPIKTFFAAMSAEYYGMGNEQAVEDMRSVLINWAKADALKLANRTANTVFSLKRALVPLLTAWSIIGDHPRISTADKRRIEAWLDKLVQSVDIYNSPGGNYGKSGSDIACVSVTRMGNSRLPGNNCQNHRYLRDIVNMQWGIITDDHNRFQKGIERYIIALYQMRPDGSLPLETCRGARAVHYTGHAVAELIFMAEMAKLQGYDLYGLEVEGVSLHTAVKFLIDAIERPEIVFKYARANFNPGPSSNYKEQDFFFLMMLDYGHNYMAWVEPYLSGFPETINSKRIRLLRKGSILKYRPLIHEFSGGNATCFYSNDFE